MRILVNALLLFFLFSCSGDKSNKPSEQAVSYFKEGLGLLNAGDYVQALQKFDLAVSEDSLYFEAYHNISICQWRLNQRMEAMLALNKTLDIDRKYLPSLLQKYFYSRELSDPDAMVEVAERMVINYPDSLRFVDLRGQAYLENKQYGKALIDFTFLVDTQPSAVEHLVNRAMVYYRIGDYIASEIDLNLAKKLDHFNPIPCNNLALVFAAKRFWPQAAEEIASARKIDPTNLLYQNNQAFIFINSGNYDDAAKIIEAIDEPDLKPFVLRNKAVLFFNKGLTKESFTILDSLSSRHPEMEWLNLYLGSIYLQQSKIDEACISFQKAKAIGDFWAKDSLNKYCQQ